MNSLKNVTIDTNENNFQIETNIFVDCQIYYVDLTISCQIYYVESTISIWKLKK